MTTKTESKLSERAKELQERHDRERKAMGAEQAICALLPEAIKLPTIANIDERERKGVYAWLSWHPEYGQDAKAFALSVLTELERAGAKPLPVSLCRWSDYRRSAEHGLTTTIPDERKDCFGSTDKLNDVEAICPLWVTPCQFTKTEAKCFYEIGGRVFKVCVEAPLRAHLQCRRIEHFGGWRFDGPCTINFPQAWHSIHTETGESVANISTHTKGYRDTEQGISGCIYWDCLTEQDKFPLTPAQFLAELMKEGK